MTPQPRPARRRAIDFMPAPYHARRKTSAARGSPAGDPSQPILVMSAESPSALGLFELGVDPAALLVSASGCSAALSARAPTRVIRRASVGTPARTAGSV